MTLQMQLAAASTQFSRATCNAGIRRSIKMVSMSDSAILAVTWPRDFKLDLDQSQLAIFHSLHEVNS